MSAEAKQFPSSSRRIYRLSGSEAIDLLQRISTADVSPLAEGRPVATLLTNEKGRVVDLACVNPERDGSLLVAGIGDEDGRIGTWLDRFIIMEDVTVADVTDAFATSVVYAEGSDGCWILPEAIPGAVVPVAMGRHRWGMAIGPREGTLGEPRVVDEPTFTLDRVASGVPWIPNEIGERRHPLEARLRTLISFTKGCYVGQEVVARLDAYRKVQMALTRFEGALGPAENTPVSLQTGDGLEAGILTTVAVGSPRACALGFLRIDLLKARMTVRTPGGIELRPIDIDTDADVYA